MDKVYALKLSSSKIKLDKAEEKRKVALGTYLGKLLHKTENSSNFDNFIIKK